ncbi:MAG: helix-turn-helix transcriptional regulator [Treponema sp.]|jgi:transcriptional regulator with XRE-family HTH domain|nr:helix-turn-helix transcriptional regulator [Treponema sp.]
MNLQQIFISNLKKFRKAKKISQMALAELCDTSGNYIGEIEMGRRIPSFEKIEKIAAALGISSHELFIQEIINDDTEDTGIDEKETQCARDFLKAIPPPIKEEIISSLLNRVRKDIAESLDAKNY